MCAAINVLEVKVLDNPARFLDPFKFEVTFECVSALSEDLEWKVVYVGSSAGPQYDQELDSVLVGPVPIGTSRFVLQTNPPDPSKIPNDDIIGATVVMVICSYRNREFIRVGYWVANKYALPLAEGMEPPKPVSPDHVERAVLSDKPRVTRFPIEWQ